MLAFARNRNQARASHDQCEELVDINYCSILARRAPALDKFAKKYGQGIAYGVPGEDEELEYALGDVLYTEAAA